MKLPGAIRYRISLNKDLNENEVIIKVKKSIAIIETSQVSSADLKQLCAQIMPEVTIHEIIDSSLIDEVAANNGPTKGVRNRLYLYYKAAESLGVDAILNQCSSVGEVVDLVQPFISVPIVKVDAAMAEKAVTIGKRIALIATVESTVGPSSRLIENTAQRMGKDIILQKRIVKDAMMLLIKTGDKERHNQMVIGEIEEAAKENDVIVLAQGSMTVLEPYLDHIKKPVLTSLRMGVHQCRDIIYGNN